MKIYVVIADNTAKYAGCNADLACNIANELTRSREKVIIQVWQNDNYVDFLSTSQTNVVINGFQPIRLKLS